MSTESLNDTTTASNVREVTVVEVRNPETHESAKLGVKAYTDFEVCIKTTNKAFIIGQSFVRRRYSDFVWLRAWLQNNNGSFSNRKTPSLPPKKLVKRFDIEFLQQRMKGLQKFLKNVIEKNVYLSDKALHLFLQSGMSVKEIENYLLGRGLPRDELGEGSLNLFTEEENKRSLNNIIEIPNTNRIQLCDECESLGTNSSYNSSISSSFADSFEKITIQDCIPEKEIFSGTNSEEENNDTKLTNSRDSLTIDMVEPDNISDFSLTEKEENNAGVDQS